jgi:hypothetical protein
VGDGVTTLRNPKIYPRIITPPDKAFRYLGPDDIPRLRDLGVEVEEMPLQNAIRIWCAKSGAHVRMHAGDYVIWERDGSGVYPCTYDAFWESHDRNIGDAP